MTDVSAVICDECGQVMWPSERHRIQVETPAGTRFEYICTDCWEQLSGPEDDIDDEDET